MGEGRKRQVVFWQTTSICFYYCAVVSILLSLLFMFPVGECWRKGAYNVCVFVCVCVCACVCVCVCLCLCLCLCLYITYFLLYVHWCCLCVCLSINLCICNECMNILSLYIYQAIHLSTFVNNDILHTLTSSHKYNS